MDHLTESLSLFLVLWLMEPKVHTNVLKIPLNVHHKGDSGETLKMTAYIIGHKWVWMGSNHMSQLS